MNHLPRIQSLTQQLREAASAQHWTALSVLDRELSGLVRELQATARQRSLTQPERQALTRLQSAHEMARNCCARELNQTSERMNAMHQQRDGWIAYAANSDWKDDTP